MLLLKACVLGQIVSLLVALTATTSEVLAKAGINAPATQSFFNYLLLAVSCGSVHVYWNGYRLRNPWWTYLFLAALDVQGNYLVTKAYQYTSITSVTLLDSTTIPAVMIMSVMVFRSKYRLGHMGGALLCTAGLALLVFTDGNSSTGGSNPALGDILVIAGACVYAVCNICQEKLLNDDTSRWEMLAMMGIFASFISGVQALVLEQDAWQSAAWGPGTIIALLGFAVALYLFYILVPSVLIMGSSTILNLSLLTSDLWAAVSRLAFFGGFDGTATTFSIALIIEVLGITWYACSGQTHVHTAAETIHVMGSANDHSPQKMKDTGSRWWWFGTHEGDPDPEKMQLLRSPRSFNSEVESVGDIALTPRTSKVIDEGDDRHLHPQSPDVTLSQVLCPSREND